MIKNLVSSSFATSPFFDYSPLPFKHVRVRHDLVRPEFVPRALKVITTHYSYRVNYESLVLKYSNIHNFKSMLEDKNCKLVMIHWEDPSPII